MSIPDDPTAQPLGDDDRTAEPDDPAQREWENTDPSISPANPVEDESLAQPIDEQEIPGWDQPDALAQPETQGGEPLIAELGEEGEGDLSPGDV